MNFQKACMRCESRKIRVFPGDDNDFYGLNPKYECTRCGFVGMPLEIAMDSSEVKSAKKIKRKKAQKRKAGGKKTTKKKK